MRVSTWYILLLVALAILQCHAAVGVDRKAKSKTSLKRKGKKQDNEGHDHVIGDNDDTDDNDDNDSGDDGEEYDSCDERADAMASLFLNMLSDELDDLLDEKNQNNQTANQIKTLEQLFNDQITAMSTTQRNKRKALLEGLQSKIAKVRAAVYTETTSTTTSSTVIQSTAVTSTDIGSSSTTSWASTTTSTTLTTTTDLVTDTQMSMVYAPTETFERAGCFVYDNSAPNLYASMLTQNSNDALTLYQCREMCIAAGLKDKTDTYSIGISSNISLNTHQTPQTVDQCSCYTSPPTTTATSCTDSTRGLPGPPQSVFVWSYRPL